MKFRSKIAAVGTVATAVAMSGAAFALWTSSGSGSATAGSASIQNSTITADANGADLYPGALGKTITVKVDNPNPYPVSLLSITGVNAADQSGCAGSNVSVATLSNGGTTPVAPTGGDPASTSIPAKAGNVNGSRTYTMSVAMSVDAPDGCAGKSFSFTFPAGGASLVQATS